MRFKELYGVQYDGININIFGDTQSHIIWEKIGKFCYLHEWRNTGRNIDGFKLGLKFLKEINMPIICSTIKDKVVTVARRYGFDIYKRIGPRLFLIRKG